MTDDLPPLPELPSPASSFAASTALASSNEGLGFRDATIGDFFGSTALISGSSYNSTNPADGFNVPIAGSDRRFKLTENVSPIPVNRFFVNYNHFSQPVRNVTLSKQDVDRVTLGLEKTFLDNSSSLEVRVPIISGLNATQDVTGSGSQTNGEFGNMTLTLKSLLWQQGNQSAISAGLSINLPTAQDANVYNSYTGQSILRIDNQSVHLLPFIAMYHQHSPRTWSMVIAQLDFDTNGNTFLTETSPNSGRFTPISRFQEQNFLYLDYSAGHWFYDNPYGGGFIRRAAIIGELHYSTTINNADLAAAGPDDGDIVTNPFNRIDVLNATGGLRFQLGQDYLLTAAVVAPLKDGENRLFDSEFALLLTKRF
ncbi:hypothetical protein [Blastopirellula marina]|nr:hypothetical protein [Blastopirellula marina]